jgi:hypothetical protein
MEMLQCIVEKSEPRQEIIDIKEQYSSGLSFDVVSSYPDHDHEHSNAQLSLLSRS